MATSPYTDPILDFLADGQPHTIAEIRVAIMAPEGAGIDQLLRGMGTNLALKRDPRKLVQEFQGNRKTYRIVARDPRNPLPIPEPEETPRIMTTDTPLYVVKDWQKLFENNRSRTVENLRWVCVPNKHDGEGYATVMEQENAAELFAAWVLILQVASKCQERGTLMREDGTPMTARTLAMKTRAEKSWFDNALNFFTTKVQWLECHMPDSQVSPACHPPVTQVTKKEGKGMEENGREGKELNERAAGQKSERLDLDELSRKIAALVPKWSPHLNGDERSSLFENERKWQDLTEDDWDLLTRWYADTSDRSKFRIKIKSRLIAEVDEELAKASSVLNVRNAVLREF